MGMNIPIVTSLQKKKKNNNNQDPWNGTQRKVRGSPQILNFT